MPYGFGEKGMLGLYSTNEHTEEEIIDQLKKFKIPYYTEVTEAVVLTESGNDESDESYKGIFIDRKTGDFKILTGRFPDKKAMINKYGTLGKDYIARKVFEKPVFDWILNNAKSSLDSYLMFSTAFSKWRHNSILDKYYIKLINDMPQLFKNVRAQDRIGGDNKSKHADKEAIELDEADYIGNYNDINNGKIYLVVYGENGNILADFTDSAPIKYSYNQYNFESVELFKWLQRAVDQVEEETGETVTGVAVKTKKKDPSPKIYSRNQIEKGYTKSVGKSWSDNRAFQQTLEDPTSEKFDTLVYCKDEQGRRIIPKPYPIYINHVIEKGNGIDDRQVWISALQALNTVYGEPENTVEAQIYGPAAHEQVYVQDAQGKEYYSNRGEVYKNVHNMEPGQDKPFLTKSGNIAHPEWKNTFGKDDIEEVLINKPISADVELEDFMLPEIEAAAERIKARNPGKKVFVQVNDEEPTEYIDIEEPQA
ncbi:unnamed protein product [Cylicocyclus nassatus]|uniref:Uncharacterized protein n=1 Tax=Cylicocyclus nassatus TaxID=53992 RepID=A0AA36MFG0_CYLNA|nr:unnamed protein product [Cylicocyclus nassatus]